MLLKINNRTFENADWNVDLSNGVLRAETDESVTEMIASIGDAEFIESYNEDILTGKWINRGIESIRKLDIGDGTMIMEIIFNLTTLSQDTELALQKGIDESVDAIFELGQIYSKLEEEYTEVQNQFNTIKEGNQRIDLLIKRLDEKVNATPSGIVERFAEIDNRLNVLADRVATLENRG